MNTMNYKDYSARIEYDPADKIFVGHIVGIRDIVGFHGSSVEELEVAFEEAVEHYLVVCRKIGQEPQRAYSGKITLRMPPETHSAVAAAAAVNDQSINQWATRTLSDAAKKQGVLA